MARHTVPKVRLFDEEKISIKIRNLAANLNIDKTHGSVCFEIDLE